MPSLHDNNTGEISTVGYIQFLVQLQCAEHLLFRPKLGSIPIDGGSDPCPVTRLEGEIRFCISTEVLERTKFDTRVKYFPLILFFKVIGSLLRI